MFNNENDFKKLISRLNIDTKPSPAHRENLRRQVLSVFNETRQPRRVRILSADTWRTFGSTIIKSQITRLAGVAAVVLIAFVLLFNTPAAKAVELSQIYEALQKIRTVCILRFAAGETEPYQKVWTSQTLNIRLFQSKGLFALWTAPPRVIKIKNLSSNTVKTVQPTPEALARCEYKIAHQFGLMPFSSITNVPQGAKWHRVDDMDVANVLPGTEAYDLTWTTVLPGIIEYRRWRFFVDPITNLPTRIETYSKSRVDVGDEYKLKTELVVEYPSERQLQTLVEDLFGQTYNSHSSTKLPVDLEPKN